MVSEGIERCAIRIVPSAKMLQNWHFTCTAGFLAGLAFC